MNSLLIINPEKQTISDEVLTYLKENYRVYRVDNYEKVDTALDDMYIDLFLVIASEIDDNVIKLSAKLKKERHNVLPLVLALTGLNNEMIFQAFQAELFLVTEQPLVLDELIKKLENAMTFARFTNDLKWILISSKEYDKSYPLHSIIYFERTTYRHFKIWYLEDGEVKNDDFYFGKDNFALFKKQFGLGKEFVQTHQSYLVNKRYVKGFDKRNQEVILTHGKNIIYGRTNFGKIRGNWWKQWI